MKKVVALVFMILMVNVNTIQAHTEVKHKILFILSAHDHGYWLSEVLTPYKLLTEAGYEVDFASPKGHKGVQAGGDYLEEDEKQLLPKINDILTQPKSLESINTSDYVALYVPGGAGPMFDLYNHPEVNRITATMYENNKPVSSACHGPAAFAGVMLSNNELMIKGKNVTAKSNAEEGSWARTNYPFLLEDKVKALQANFSAAAPGEPWVVQDGNLLTGQNPSSAGPLAIKLIEMLKPQNLSKN